MAQSWHTQSELDTFLAQAETGGPASGFVKLGPENALILVPWLATSWPLRTLARIRCEGQRWRARARPEGRALLGRGSV